MEESIDVRFVEKLCAECYCCVIVDVVCKIAKIDNVHLNRLRVQLHVLLVTTVASDTGTVYSLSVRALTFVCMFFQYRKYYFMTL